MAKDRRPNAGILQLTEVEGVRFYLLASNYGPAVSRYNS